MARRSFKQHMISAFVQVVLLPMAILGLMVMLWFVFNAQAQARTALDDTASRLRILLDDHLSYHRQALDLLGHQMERLSLPQPGDTLTPWLDAFTDRYPGVLTMLVSDRDGLIIAASPSERLAPMIQDRISIQDRDYFRVAMDQGGVYISDAFQGRGFGSDPIVAISRRLDGPAGYGVGIVQLSLDLSLLTALDQRSTGASTIEMLITDSHGRVVAASDPAVYPFLSETPPDWRVAPADACRVPLFAACFTVARSVDPVAWTVMVRQSPADAYRPLVFFVLFTAAALGMAVLVALLEGQRLIRGMAEPLAELAEVVGGGSEALPQLPVVPGASPREVAVLHDAFESLSSQLAATHARLQAQMDKLEAEVSMRTAELEQSRTELFDFIEHAPALIMSINELSQLAYANQAWRQALGYDDAELSGMKLSEIVLEDRDTTPVRSVMALGAGQRLDQLTWNIQAKDGSVMQVAGSVLCLRDASDHNLWQAVLRDVTALAEAERALRHKSELLDLFVRHAPAAVAMFDNQMRCLAVSERWLRDYQLTTEQLIGHTLEEALPNRPAHWPELHQRCLQGEVITLDEDPYTHADGHVDYLRWESRPWSDADGKIGGLIIHVELVTQEKQLIDRLRETAERDPLTGLLNRRALSERLADLSQATVESGGRFAVMHVSLHRFADLAEQHGEAAGENILRSLARRLDLATRQGDLVGRLSGDHFVVVIARVDDRNPPGKLVNRLRERIQKPIEISGTALAPRLHVEVTLSDGSVDPEELLRGSGPNRPGAAQTRSEA